MPNYCNPFHLVMQYSKKLLKIAIKNSCDQVKLFIKLFLLLL